INPLNDAGDFAQIVKIAKEIRDDLMHASLPGTIAGNEIHGSKVRYLNLLIQAAEKKLKK
ncbi:MAG: hypothetical protein Q7K42_01595, partial [Candidatus Diapherotrites archaeon]|nr:hypothetical protein [Candidatus Diapherotrites archaeon]